MNQLIESQAKCLLFYRHFKQPILNKILSEYGNTMNAFMRLIDYENKLLELESSEIMQNDLPGHEEEFEQIEKELING